MTIEEFKTSFQKTEDITKKADKTNNTPKNKKKKQADATVADLYITFPTNNGILNQGRKQCKKFIDKL